MEYQRYQPIPKPTPRAIEKAAKTKSFNGLWQRVCKRVDARDKRTCQVTGAHLDAGSVNAWHALERHHLEYRSANKSRKFNDRNVWTVSRAIHQLIHVGALKVLDKALNPAKDVREIAYVAWNRAVVVKGDEPIKLKPQNGVKRVELPEVAHV
jgi:hypothetical protein